MGYKATVPSKGHQDQQHMVHSRSERHSQSPFLLPAAHLPQLCFGLEVAWPRASSTA